MNLKRRAKRKLRDFAPNLIDSTQVFFGIRDKTHANEFKVLHKLLEKLSPPKGFKFIDVGAGDGFNMSVAWPLSKFYECSGLLIERDTELLNKSRTRYKNNPLISFCPETVNPNNVKDVLRQYNFLDSYYLKIDIDSYDLDLLRSILKSGVRPEIFSIEINELIPPPVSFELLFANEIKPFIPPLYGCSLQAVVDFATSQNYSLYGLAFNNAFFISNKGMNKLSPYNSRATLTVYQEDFLNLNWKQYFPWDMKFEHWFHLNSSDLLEVIRKDNLFDKRFMKLS